MVWSRLVCLTFVVLVATSAVASPPPPGVRARLGSTDLWHGPAVHDIAFAPDSKSFYTLSSSDTAVRQWDVGTGAELRVFAGHKPRPTAIAVSRDGRLLVTTGSDRSICLWNTATGAIVSTFTRKLVPMSVAFSPDSRTLAVLPGEEFGWAAVLDVTSGKELNKFEVGDSGPARKANANPFFAARMAAPGQLVPDEDDLRSEGTIVYSPDGRYLAAHSAQVVTLWDTLTEKRVRKYEAPQVDLRRARGFAPGPGGVMAGVGLTSTYVGLQFTADSQTLLAAAGEGGVTRWELTSIDPLDPLKCDSAQSVSVSPNGEVTAAIGRGWLSLWDRKGMPLHQVTADTTMLLAVACAPDGKTVVTGDRKGRLRVWDVATGKERLLPGPRPLFRTLAVTADGAITADEFSLRHWDLTGEEVKQFKLDPETVAELLLSPDGRLLAVQRTKGEVDLLDTKTGEVKATLAAKTRQLTTLQFSSDGRWLAAMDTGVPAGPGGVGPGAAGGFGRPRPRVAGAVVIFDAHTGKEVRALTESTQQAGQFAFLPDGRTLVTAINGDSLCVWETLTGKPRRHLANAALARSREEILAELGVFGGFAPARVAVAERKFLLTPQLLAVSPDGSSLAVVQRTSVSLVDLQTGKRQGRLENLSGNIAFVAYSPDGRLLATSGNNQTIHLWDAGTGKEIGSLSGHRGPVRSAAFTPDSKMLVTTADDQVALVWDLTEATKVARQANKDQATPRPINELWNDLGSDDAQLAEMAMREFVSRKAETLSLLKEQLRPVPKVEAKQLEKWVAQLDDEDFAVRDHALAELEKAGEQGRPALEDALKKEPSPEVKRQGTELLKKLDDRVYSLDLVREVRALETLEKIGGTEAVQLLEKITTGATPDPRTLDAKAALARLKLK